MSFSLPGAATTLPSGSETPDAPGAELRLLVIEPRSSRNVALPTTGFFVVGRGADCDVRIEDPSVSRRHARIVVQDGQARVVDMDSRNGVRVNGVTIHGAHALATGDVIGVGEVTLIVRPRAKVTARRPLLGAGEVVVRLDHEVERALGYARPLSVVLLSIGARSEEAPALVAALDPALRPLDLVGRASTGEIAVILPEVGASEARVVAATLLEALGARGGEGGAASGRAEARAGFASCPADGCDAETLLAAARAAAHARGPSAVAGPAERTTALTFGDRTVLVADPAMQRIFALIERLAAAPIPVLVVGETGTGKEHAAFAVHTGSPRRAGPFLAVNCAAIPDTLWESELFGFEKGAFSGAIAAKPGLFERADGGTLFLDEVGELSLAAQAKFLRVLETGAFCRVGEARERRADVRIVAATNRNLEAEVAAHRFREDLFYRLSTATVVLPPLRERPTEIPILADHFLQAARRRAGQSPLSIAPDAVRALAGHAWPGNVRELKNAMELCAATVPFGVVERWHLPEAIGGSAAASVPPAPPAAATFRPIAEELEELEKERMREALVAAGGIKTHAARLIQMPERTFRSKLRQYRLDPA